MNSVQMRVPRTLGWIVALLALGLGAVPSALAELPKAGMYKGTLTIVRTVRGPSQDSVPLESKVSFKAVARVDAEGYVRIIYTGDRDPIYGKLVETGTDAISLAVNGGYYSAANTARGFSVLVQGGDTLEGPDANTAIYDVQYVTKLVRTGK